MSETSELPRVLIGSPVFEGKEYCRREFVDHVRKLTYPNKTFVMVDNSKGTSYLAKLRREGVPAVRVNRGRNSRDALANASNYLRKRALEGGYDYLLMLESDIFPPLDVIERLLANADVSGVRLQDGKRVIGAPYHITDGKNWNLCIFVTEMKKEGLLGTRPLRPNETEAFLDGSLRQVHGMGVGCTLIHRSILEAFPFWYSELDDDRMAHTKNRKHPDVYFYLDLHNERIPVYCDTTLYSVHRPSDWNLVRDV